MVKYKILRGNHIEGKDENGKDILYRQGQVVDSQCDLLKHNRRGGPPKFQLYNEASDQDDGLDSFTIAELRSYAAEEEVDIEGLTRKQEIIDAIRKSSVKG